MGGSTKELDMIARQTHQQAINMNTKIVAWYILGVKKLASRPVKQTELNKRMEITSQFVPSDRRLLGSTHNRQVCVNDDNTDTELQQLILGPTHKRGRCIRSDGLVIIKQLRKCSVRPSAENIRHSD